MHLWISFTPNAAVLFVDVAIQPEVRFIAKQNSLMKIGNNGNLVLGPFDESTPCLMIVLMNCQTKLRINPLTAVKSVAILERRSRKISISAERRGRADRKTNQEIKSNHWEVGGRPQCDKCGCRVRNCSQHRFHDFGDNFKLQEQLSGGFSSGRPRGTTPADDRYIVLQARRNRRQTAGEIARHTTQANGRPISRFTVARRLHGGGLFARRPVRCVPLTPAHRRRRSLWCREHRNWRDNEWGRVLFTDESRFSLSSDSHRILIWRERGSRNHPSNIIERDRYGGRGVLVWGGIVLGSRTDLYIFDAGSVNGTRYCNEILLPYVRLFRGAMGLQFLFMDDNAPCHRTVAAE
ncbi:transposable element Tcb1 transposase [Trichonephila clavipes]|nr:transposable element Tcb1 transposase [Trichonephila clavipes]